MNKYWWNFILVWMLIAATVGFGFWWYGVQGITAMMVFVAISAWAALFAFVSAQSKADEVSYDSRMLIKVGLLWVSLALVIAVIAFATPTPTGVDNWTWSLTCFSAAMSPFWTFLAFLAFVWLVRSAYGIIDDVRYDGALLTRFGWLWVTIALVVAAIAFASTPPGLSTLARMVWSLMWFIAVMSPFFTFLAFWAFGRIVNALKNAGTEPKPAVAPPEAKSLGIASLLFSLGALTILACSYLGIVPPYVAVLFAWGVLSFLAVFLGYIASYIRFNSSATWGLCLGILQLLLVGFLLIFT